MKSWRSCGPLLKVERFQPELIYSRYSENQLLTRGDNDLTGRDLMIWILDNKAEDAEFEVQYRDAGGEYKGTDRPYLSEDTGTNEYGWQYRRILL